MDNNEKYPPSYNQGGYNPNAYNRGGYNQGGYNPNGYNNGNMPPKPGNYLVWAILTTIFCCLPLGVVAIIYSVQTDSAYNAGNYMGAVDNSNKAKTWCIASAVVAIAVNIICAIFWGGAVYASLLNM